MEPIYLTCPPVGPGRVALVYQAIEAWARSPVLSTLVSAFGAEVPYKADVPALIAWLLDFSDCWDFRRLQREATAKDIGEGARWLLDSSHLTPHQQQLTLKSAGTLGLIGIGEPMRESFDYVLILGGARLSCLLRPRLASELIEKHRIQPKAVVLLAAARPVAESEREATITYAPDAVTEFDLMNAGAERAFRLAADLAEERFDDPENPNRSWVIRRYQASEGSFPIVSLSAPSSEPDRRRANSADTYEFFFSRFSVPAYSSLLLVTSEIYVPYQQLEAIRTLALPHDVTVETVGFPSAWGGKLQGLAELANYLQEIRSTLQSAHRFIATYPRESDHEVTA